MTAAATWLWRGLLAAFLVFMLGPLLLVILFSFSSNALISFPLGELTFDWYRVLFANAEFWSALKNSLIIAGATGLISTVAGTMAALSLVQFRPATSSTLIACLTLPVTLPPLLLAVALVVFFVRFLELPLSPATVIAGHVLIAQPFVILIVLARLANFDYASMDAARDLGATRWQAFRKVLLPDPDSAHRRRPDRHGDLPRRLHHRRVHARRRQHALHLHLGQGADDARSIDQCHRLHPARVHRQHDAGGAETDEVPGLSCGTRVRGTSAP